MKPEWLNDKNGIWTYELNNIHDILAEYHTELVRR